MKRFATFIVCCFVGVFKIQSMEWSLSFGTLSHDNPNNMYIASMNVGTGECHVVRKGDDIAIIDAGFRGAGINVHEIINRLTLMLSHQVNGHIEQGILRSIFITHPHADHMNMVSCILAANIIRDHNFSIFLGGLGNEYVVDICFIPERQLIGNGTYANIIEGVTFFARDVDHNLVEARQPQDINTFGAVIGLQFANRKVAFIGDIDNDGFKAIVSLNLRHHVFGQQVDNDEHNQQAFVHPMRAFLENADIVAGFHHGLLKNGEGYIYEALLQNKSGRLFIVSGNPTDPLYMLRCEILLNVQKADRIFDHVVSLCNTSYNHFTRKYVGVTSINKVTDLPLFPTHDTAPLGFVLTKITPESDVFIYDSNLFRKVL